MITAICKSGDKSDPSNYRGIFVSSSLSKLSAELFCQHPGSVKDYTVLYKNATCYILSGLDFSQDFVLRDHIFSFRTTIDKNVTHTPEGKLFRCFIDLNKAFDSVWYPETFTLRHNGFCV